MSDSLNVSEAPPVVVEVGNSGVCSVASVARTKPIGRFNPRT